MTIKLTVGLLIVVLAASASSGQTPLGTEFTYQGRLKNGGAPATGLHDLRFQLYDAASGGVQVGTTQCVDNVNVTEGLFTARLDFGGAAFNGDERWLEIGVRADSAVGNCSGGTYTTLAPRENLTPAPYAIQTRGIFVNSTGKVGIGTTNPDRRLTVGGGLSVYDASHQGVAIQSDEIIFANAVTEDFAYQYTASPEQHDFFIGGGSAMTIAPNGNVGIGTMTPAARLHAVSSSTAILGQGGQRGVQGNATGASGGYGVFGVSPSSDGAGVYGTATHASGIAFGVYGTAASTAATGVFGDATAGTGTTYGVYGHSNSTTGRGIFGAATASTGVNFGGYFQSASTAGHGIYSIASAASGDTTGGEFVSNSPTGIGVLGTATATAGVTYGGRFECASASGVGVLGKCSAGAGASTGVYGQSESTLGRGMYGLATAGTGVTYGGRFESQSTSGRGVYGEATALTGPTTGVYGETRSIDGSGVFGFAAPFSGNTYGVYGASSSVSGRGVYGIAGAGTGGTAGVSGECASSTSGRGVEGFATANSGTTYGVYGESNSNTGWGVWAQGRLGALGTKSFCIDHPDDPENKYLLHYSTESPEAINFYRGTVVLDSAGNAVVEMPHYFARINKTPSYQLTPVGAPMPMLYVAAEIDEAALSAGAKAGPGEAAPQCSFRIAGGATGAKVSWRVEAIRNDRWVQQHGAPVEVGKQDSERGTYLNPELYGQPPEKGVNYRAERDSATAAAVPDSVRE